MPATHIPLGEPAHEGERQGIRYLVENLPSSYTVYSNAWLVDLKGVVYELDTVVVAPHGIYVTELKCHTARVYGTDFDWTIESRPPRTERSPLRLNRITAQVLATMLRRESVEAGRRWVEHFIFLPVAPLVDVRGRASNGRVHGKASIIAALQDARTFVERSGRSELPPVDQETRGVVDRLLRGADPARKPHRRIREYRLEGTRDRTDRYVEYDAVYDFTGAEERRVLRVYPLAAADATERAHVLERVRWETQVLGRIGRHETILNALPPFEDEAGLCLPFEAFQGVTLSTWVENHHRDKALGGREGLKARVELFDKIADAIDYAHRQGIVHRLLGPDAVLLEDRAVGPAARVTGFDLAKQVRSEQTVAMSTVHDERLRWAAPEVAQGFSSATPLSDEFGLGLILGYLLAGRALFESTADLVRNGGRATRLAELNPNVPQSLDAAVQQMIRVRPADRFGTIGEARAAVRAAVEGKQAVLPIERKLEPENIPDQTQLGTDYIVVSKLGAGGLATVYAARHQLTGTTRALKVARAEPTAEEALDAEFRVMSQLDHPAIVRAIDVSGSVVPGRRTLIMERVKGKPLSEVLASGPDPDAATIRHWAEDLFAALDFLDQRKVTHKDLKPDNLIVGPEGLCVIDFSLAGHAADALFIGTALYRDPALRSWDSAADRYAAALCLFELCAGRHPFEGQAPSPGQAPRIEADEFDAPGLAAFFAKALHPVRAERFPSAVAMRVAFLDALGVKGAAPAAQPGLAMQANASSPDLPLAATELSSFAVERLKLAGIQTQGDLVALTPDRLRNVSGLGKKKRKQILEFRELLIARGVSATAAAPGESRRSLVPQLEGDPNPLVALELPAGLADLLAQSGYTAIGKLAAATASDLNAVPGVGRGRIAQIVERLQAFADRERGAGAPATLSAFWAKATAAFEGQMEKVFADTYGIRGTRRTQEQIGQEIGVGQGEVSRLLAESRRRLDRGVLAPIVEEVESQLAVQGHVARTTELARLLEDRYPADEGLDSIGVVRLVKWMGEPRLATARNPERDDEELLLGGGIPPDAIRTFVERARELAAWPPKETDAVRRALKGVLPEYDLDHIGLACKLVPDLRRTDAEELFEAPIGARDAVEYVLRRERPPMQLSALQPAIERTFGDAALLPPPSELEKVVSEIPDFIVAGDRILSVQGKSIVPTPVAPDPTPEELRVAAKPEEVVAGELLRTAAQRRGFRLVVAPPAEHREIAASIARAVEGTIVSFEEELLARLEPDWQRAELAEQFEAMQNRLTKAAEATYQDLLARHGEPGRRVVVSDTGILGVCNALHLIGKLATETSSRDAGVWAVVIPGVIHQRAPLFNEERPVANIPGMVLPVPRAIPA